MATFNGILAGLSALQALTKSSTVSLGSVTFTSEEVPDQLIVGVTEQWVQNRLPGGALRLQALGPAPDPMAWTGRFTGANALSRAQILRSIADQELQITFTVMALSFQVVIEKFSFSITNQGFVVPYNISLIVVPSTAATVLGQSTGLASLFGPSVAGAITSVSDTITSASTYLNGLTSQVQGAIGSITPLANLVGLGGPLSMAGNYLTQANLLTGGLSTGLSTSALNAGAAQLMMAGASLSSAAISAVGNLSSITGAASAGGLIGVDSTQAGSAAANSVVLQGSIVAGTQVNVAAQALASGANAPSSSVPFLLGV